MNLNPIGDDVFVCMSVRYVCVASHGFNAVFYMFQRPEYPQLYFTRFMFLISNFQKTLIYVAIYISGSSSSVDLSSLTRANQSTEASALLYLLQTYARANNEEKTHPKVN